MIGILIDKCNAFIEVHHPSLLGRITNRHYTEYSIEEIQDIINSINDILENMPIFLNELINLSNAYGMYLKEIDYYLGISITIKSYTDTFALEDNEKMHDLYNLISGKNMSLEQKQQLVTGEKASVRNQIIKYNDIKECLDSLSDKLSYGINTGEYTLDMYLAIIREIIEKITFSDESSITKTEGKKK